VTSFVRWTIQANCTQLQDKCMSFLERLSHWILTYDWAVVCTGHLEFMHNLRRRLPEWLYQGSPIILMFCLSIFSHAINSWNDTLICCCEYICNAIIRSSV
jgi:hypothetical protein